MAKRSDLDLARRLLEAGVLTKEQVRQALADQEELLVGGRDVRLEPILEKLGMVPVGGLAACRGPSVFEAQPFGDYRVTGVLGEGGASTVYEAVYTPNGTRVALKVLDPVLALRPDFLERFRREAELHITLDHPNVVAGYQTGYLGGLHFYSMEPVEGLTLLEIIDRRGHLSNEEALSITLQAATALGGLHDRGILHRDVKPGNIMVEPSGRTFLIDLGLVADLGGATGESQMTVGTVEYVSPEQARGRTDLDARSDVYGLGMTLYHMVVGEVAFGGENDYEIMAQQVLSAMDGQKMKTRRIDPFIYALITQMSAKDREERFPSMADVVRQIEGYVADVPVPVDFGAPPVADPVAPATTPPPGPAPAPRGGVPAPTRRRPGRGSRRRRRR